MASQDGRATFERVLNFRDVGQYINHITNRQLIKPSLLFRSARPDAATPADRQRLVNDFKIRTVIDLRTPTEHIEQTRKHAADIPSAPALTPSDPAHPLRISELEYKDVNLNGNGYSNALIKKLSYGQTAKLFGLYAFGWRKEAISVLGKNVMAERRLAGLAEDSLAHSKKEVKEAFSVLCNPASYPVMVHCTQGKDRTGLIVLLMLLVCGVSQEAIQRDYRMSESELVPERDEKLAEIRSIGLPDSFADCPEDWTSTICGYTEESFGGVQRYLEGCGVTTQDQNNLRSFMKAG